MGDGKKANTMSSVKRPKYLNLVKLRLPVPGIVSILHRISGFGLFVIMGLILWLFGLSLESKEGFEFALNLMSNSFSKILLIGILWAFTHHLIAGIRFLLLDIHWGTDILSARITSMIVLVLSLSFTMFFAFGLW